jgi:hypothetical protein
MPAFDAESFLGQTELSLGKYRDAAEHVTFAIENLPASKAEEMLPLLKEDLAEAKAHITTLRITVDQPDADVALDGRILAKSSLDTDLFVDPGKHTITATHAELGSTESAIDTKAGEESKIALQLVKPPPVPVETPPAPELKTPADLDKPSKIETNSPPVVEPHHGIEGKTIVLIAGGAVTLIAAGTATVFGLKERSARNDADSLAAQVETQYGKYGCVTSGAASSLCASLADKSNDKRHAGRIANASFAVAGVTAAATVIIYALWPRAKTPTSAFVMVPILSPSAGGLGIQGDF